MGDIGTSRRRERDEREEKRHHHEEVEEEEDYEVDEFREGIKSSRGSRFNLIANELGLAAARARRKFSRHSILNSFKDLPAGQVIHPDNRYIIIYIIHRHFFLFFFEF